MIQDQISLKLDDLMESFTREQSPSKQISIIGHPSLLNLALILSQSNLKKLKEMPHIIVVSRESDISDFIQCIQFFDATIHVYPLYHFDVSPYSGLYPKPKVIADRISFLFHAQNAKANEVFITSVGALRQKTLSFSTLKSFCSTLKVGDELPLSFLSFLTSLGYSSCSLVESQGQFSQRGGLLDIFSPAHNYPTRIELFENTISSLRSFHPETQRTLSTHDFLDIIPCREIIWTEKHQEKALKKISSQLLGRGKVSSVESRVNSNADEVLYSFNRQQYFHGIDFLISYFYDDLKTPLDHFSSPLNIWLIDPAKNEHHFNEFLTSLKSEFSSITSSNSPHPRNDEDRNHSDFTYLPRVEDFLFLDPTLPWPEGSILFSWQAIEVESKDQCLDFFDHVDSTSDSLTKKFKVDLGEGNKDTVSLLPSISYGTTSVRELSQQLKPLIAGSEEWNEKVKVKFLQWKNQGYSIFIGIKNRSQTDRLRLFLERLSFDVYLVEEGSPLLWNTWIDTQRKSFASIHLLMASFPESIRNPTEFVVFLNEDTLMGKKKRSLDTSSNKVFEKQAQKLSFGDLHPGDFIVHKQHGIGQYEGLKVLCINDIDVEFIQLMYKDNNRLFLPIYRIHLVQKYSGANSVVQLDKLGGQSWDKTKKKVKSQLRDIASSLLQLYAQRSELHRPAFSFNEGDFHSFESSFPYDETKDQLKAVNDLIKDLLTTKPMDRLICGDVGFGKTEIAMRAAFMAVSAKKQVCVLAPTTILSFQHIETFKFRFRNWPINIRVLNRFVSPQDSKKILEDLKQGKVDILIGTHRLLSKDVEFRNLGLLIIDEEQKFGVTHKEKIKHLKKSIDVLTLSATPIPRTLNLSLMGLRDLSIINTPPLDRLPTRTFITKWNNEVIKNAILSEVKRGGQIYFIHNRVQSIYELHAELKLLLPGVRMKVAHGQLPEHDLEKIMLQFFHHEIDLLICTTIVESGMDVPRANTMFIDQAHTYGVSQLYQLRGRVGRSKERAYCYLIIPRSKPLEKEAQERLRIIQENTALGSGIRIAQYDLELRGTGEILGEDQSGHINAVGYETFLSLLSESVDELRGDTKQNNEEIDPEINLKIPALIPEFYIPDIRLRLVQYKTISDIRTIDEANDVEESLRDQFGPIPEPTLNLLGLALIQSQCRELGVRDLTAGSRAISLIFTAQTRFKPDVAIQLALKSNKKYSLSPDQRLNIRMNQISWNKVFDELDYLLKLT